MEVHRPYERMNVQRVREARSKCRAQRCSRQMIEWQRSEGRGEQKKASLNEDIPHLLSAAAGVMQEQEGGMESTIGPPARPPGTFISDL